MKKRTLIIVGAGPIGLEAALRGASDGYDVTVLERGDVGAAVRSWGHVKLFTPFIMNSSPAGRNAAGSPIDPDRLLTGRDFADEYLRPLAECPALQGRVLHQHEVAAVSRATYGKADRIGRPNRSEARFRVLANTSGGQQVFESDVLIDCTGFIARHRHIGAGGIPCPGEDLLADNNCYSIPDATADNKRFAGRHTLVIGSGYSAATSVCTLAKFADTNLETKVTWITRGAREVPMAPIADDPLPERRRLTEAANQLAIDSSSCVTWAPGPHIERISEVNGGYCIDVRFANNSGDSDKGRGEQFFVDDLIANVGYRPNARPFEELQIHRCYATEGPIKMAAHLLEATSGDCLQQTSAGAALLKNPEPNFYILGAASYGRDARFLLQIGLKQVEELFDHLKAEQAGDAE